MSRGREWTDYTVYGAVMITKIRIEGVPTEKEYNSLSFGRRLEYRHLIQHFQDTAKTGHVSQKRTTSAKALKEFLILHEATQYYARFEDSAQCRDDCYQIWYK